jgi:hypothetical protein
MPVIPVNKVVDLKRIIGNNWRAEEEERHKKTLEPRSTLSFKENYGYPFLTQLFSVT